MKEKLKLSSVYGEIEANYDEENEKSFNEFKMEKTTLNQKLLLNSIYGKNAKNKAHVGLLSNMLYVDSIKAINTTIKVIKENSLLDYCYNKKDIGFLKYRKRMLRRKNPNIIEGIFL